uniref:Ovule protein n=1 Tax=Gongylonema pulchrum TaxID=637853 RepID=A0A183DDH5_9BILA
LKRRHLIPRRTLTTGSMATSDAGEKSGAVKSSVEEADSEHRYREASSSPNTNVRFGFLVFSVYF